MVEIPNAESAILHTLNEESLKAIRELTAAILELARRPAHRDFKFDERGSLLTREGRP